jgi:hypothetical protein
MPRATAIAVVPSDLVTSLQTGRVHLFVGSGVSASAGITGWDQLIADMISIIRQENVTFTAAELDQFLNAADHLDVAELFRKTVGPHAYFRFLRARLPPRDSPFTIAEGSRTSSNVNRLYH